MTPLYKLILIPLVLGITACQHIQLARNPIPVTADFNNTESVEQAATHEDASISGTLSDEINGDHRVLAVE